MIDYRCKYLKYKLKYINSKKGGANHHHLITDELESILINTLGTYSIIVLFLNFLCIKNGNEPKYTLHNVIEQYKKPPRSTRHNPIEWEGVAPQELRGSTSVHWQSYFNNNTLDSTKGDCKIQLPNTHNFCQCYAPYLCVNKSRGIFHLLQDNNDKKTATLNIQKMAELLIEFFSEYILIDEQLRTNFLKEYRDIMVTYEEVDTPYITKFLDDFDNGKDLTKYKDDFMKILYDLSNNVDNKAELLATNK